MRNKFDNWLKILTKEPKKNTNPPCKTMKSVRTDCFYSHKPHVIFLRPCNKRVIVF